MNLLNEANPVDIGRKLNAHKTFRRRPRPLISAALLSIHIEISASL